MTKVNLTNGLAIFVLLGLALSFAYPAFLIESGSPKAIYYVMVILPGLILLCLDGAVFAESLKSNRGMQLVFIMLAYWCMTLLWGSEGVAGSQFRRMLAVLIYLCVVWHVFTHYPQFITRFYFLLFVLFAVGVFWSLGTFPSVKILLGGHRLGNKAGFGQAIHAAHYYGVFFSLALGFLLFSKHRVLLILSGAVCGLALLAIILTKSRGSYLAVAVAVIFAAGLYVRHYKKYILAAGLCVVLALLALAIYHYYPAFILSRGSSHRYEIWAEAWHMIQGNFWLGIGLGERPGITARGFAHAHNLYLNIWLTTGVFGLLLFLLAVGWVVARAIRRPLNKVAGCLTAMVFFLAAMMTDSQQLINSPNEAWLCFWFCFACLAGCNAVNAAPVLAK
ncbi:O-antigen ligase family protein [Dasania sp. GY-MA-18]|uniref:O-antigen ligase family protein n=1 Tax=Dasania phycosphaerae TaxID=2950436 RepID=A0A9J6RJF6_9GAMM|nr:MULTISPECIES: O-antigen ligase family protein [Dasania]MCR8922120.1 O-antigen ligase family protein [Dasania sp. GY-MA-18]MCZ0864548.1 O-antigen ligase family protein [Dasania phycosphaerae]MCZ0868276.1 O-antigen ligase family protein [Dasania phycosphaerae]